MDKISSSDKLDLFKDPTFKIYNMNSKIGVTNVLKI